MWEKIIQAQIIGKNIGRELVNHLKVPDYKNKETPSVRIPGAKKTDIILREDFKVNKSHEVFDIKGSGVIDEISIKSSSDFKVKLDMDKRSIYDDFVSDLIDISEDVDNIVAVQRDGKYIFGIEDMYFTSDARLILSVSGTVTFDLIFVKYEVIT